MRGVVVGTVRRHGHDLTVGRLKQRGQLIGTIGGTVSQQPCDDLAGAPASCTNALRQHCRLFVV